MTAVNPGDEGSATSTTHAATIAHNGGVITTEALTTADAFTAYTMNVTDVNVLATSVVVASVALGTATTGIPVIGAITPSAGAVNIQVLNASASAALNGTIIISYAIVG